MTRIIRRTPPPASSLPGVRVPDDMAEANIQKILSAKPILEQLDDESSSKVDYPGVISRYMEKITNRGTAIRAFCVGCSGGQLSEVRDCQVKKCALYPYRMGTDPGNLKSIKRLAKEQAAKEGEE